MNQFFSKTAEGWSLFPCSSYSSGRVLHYKKTLLKSVIHNSHTPLVSGNQEYRSMLVWKKCYVGRINTTRDDSVVLVWFMQFFIVLVGKHVWKVPWVYESHSAGWKLLFFYYLKTLYAPWQSTVMSQIFVAHFAAI